MNMTMRDLDPVYADALGGLPGVVSFKVLRQPSRGREWDFDGRLKLRTEIGSWDFLIQVYRTHLGHQTTDLLIAAIRNSPDPVLLLAPHIGGLLAEKLASARINYLDARGNCHIVVPPLYIHIEGKTAPALPRANKGLRAPAYQALFAYLADAALLNEPLRTVADEVGVSRQPASDMKHRLIKDGYVFEAKSRLRWHTARRRDALSLWLHGYEAAVRPSLLWGTYRTPDATPGDLEARIRAALSLPEAIAFRWGGSTAGFRLTGHYRGTRTIVHMASLPSGLPRRLKALPDPLGNLLILNTFGEINSAPRTDTVHPLLVYSEMLNEDDERAREAAQILFEEQIAPAWERES
jgi:hypothetical protein